MKPKFAIFSKLRSLSLILSTLFCASILAQVQPDKLRIVPTVEGDPHTEFLIATHATDSLFKHERYVDTLHFMDDRIMFTSANDYVEYQIFSPLGGTMAAVLSLASKVTTAEVNVSIYKTESETWSETGTTNNVFNNSWTTPEEHYYPIELEEATAYTLRVTFLNGGTDFFGIKVMGLMCCGRSLLSNLKINGTTLKGFAPNIFQYNIPLLVGASSVTIDATAEHERATVKISDNLSDLGKNETYTVTVTAESGVVMVYDLRFFDPIEITDGLILEMAEDRYYERDITVSDTLLSSFYDESFIEYYVYSVTDKDVLLRVNAVNGNLDGVNSQLNVAAYSAGSTWILDEANSKEIPRKEVDQWSSSFAMDVDFKLSLKAGEPMLLRIYGITNAIHVLGKIYGLSFHDHLSNSVGKTSAKGINVFGGASNIAIQCNENFVGASVQIYDVSGRCVVDEFANSTRAVYTVKKSGLYIVKVVSKYNEISTFKCYVK